MILHCKAILSPGQPGLTKWILLWIMPLVQDYSLDLLTCSPVRYHWATDAPNTTIAETIPITPTATAAAPRK